MRHRFNKKVMLLVSIVLFSPFGFSEEIKSSFPSSTTEHNIKIQGQLLNYKTTVGLMPIYNKQHKLIATMSYFAYQKIDQKKRPITFVWSGGPGNSALLDNFLVSGPKIIHLKNGEMADNPSTWLRFTDLVYIDMVGTGWGRPTNPSDQKTIFTPEGDADTFAEFIKTYLVQIAHQYSNVFLAGESYGGYRTQLVTNILLKNFIHVRGIILQSPLLTPAYTYGDNAPITTYILTLPTYIRTALFYKKLSPEFQKNPEKTIEEGIQWAMQDYSKYLLLGIRLTDEQRKLLEDTLHAYTGLSREVIRNSNYRISMSTFRNNLLKNENKSVDYTNGTEIANELVSTYNFYVFSMPSFIDSSMITYSPAMRYIANSLKFQSLTYYINYFDPSEVWQWKNNSPVSKEVISVLRDNMVIDKKMKLFVGVGYYDTDIPYLVTTTLIDQMFPISLKDRITIKYYEGGHMFSIDPTIRSSFNGDIAAFFENSEKSQ